MKSSLHPQFCWSQPSIASPFSGFFSSPELRTRYAFWFSCGQCVPLSGSFPRRGRVLHTFLVLARSPMATVVGDPGAVHKGFVRLNPNISVHSRLIVLFNLTGILLPWLFCDRLLSTTYPTVVNSRPHLAPNPKWREWSFPSELELPMCFSTLWSLKPLTKSCQANRPGDLFHIVKDVLT